METCASHAISDLRNLIVINHEKIDNFILLLNNKLFV